MEIVRITTRAACLVLLILFTMIFLEPAAQAQGRGAESFQIKSMQAKLFKNDEGVFGDDLIGSGEAQVIWNVGVNYISDTVLVIVEVAGTPGVYESKPRLVFTATAGRRVIMSKSVGIYWIKDNGTFNLAFLVPTSGCDPIKLSARFPAQRRSATLTKLLNFQCGE